MNHYNLVHKFIPLPQAMKMPDAKSAVDREWEKLEKILAWQLTKVRNKIKEVIDEVRKVGKTAHFAPSTEICHLKNSELKPIFFLKKKTKGRVVLRGDFVKDDSGSYAVCTEQGSSASQMTAAKVKDISSRLPGCAGQAADAVSAYTRVKMEDAPELLKNFQSQHVQIFGYVFHDTSGPNHGQTQKIQWFLLIEICLDTHLLASRQVSRQTCFQPPGVDTHLETYMVPEPVRENRRSCRTP